MRKGLNILSALFAAGGMVSWSLSWSQLQEKKYGEYFEEEKPWVEVEAVLPEYPRPENLIQVYVSAVASNIFLVDAKSLSAGEDGVVRYAIVIKASGGATNVSFEGVRCKTKEQRLYALGRGDNSWAKARTKNWTDIRPGSYQAVLYREYFCPRGAAIYKAEEGVDALRRGGHPQAR
jgi:hypothetical protein